MSWAILLVRYMQIELLSVQSKQFESGTFNYLLDRLDTAVKPEDMNIPGFRFHSLTGNRKGSYSVTVTGNWRITFRFDGEDAIDLNLEDYH